MKHKRLLFSLLLLLIFFTTTSSNLVHAEQLGVDSDGYMTLKLSDQSTVMNLKSPAGWRYNDNSSASKTYVYTGQINLYFLCNLVKGSSITWLDDDHTQVKVILNKKTYIFTDGAYDYTVNGVKKSLYTARYASTKPKMDADGNPTSSAYVKLWKKRSENLTTFDYIFAQESLALNNKVQDVIVYPFYTQYMTVPLCFLHEEGFMAATSAYGVSSSEICMYIKADKVNIPTLQFTSTNRISKKTLVNIKYTDQFNKLPADIRAIAVANYQTKLPANTFNYEYAYELPYQTYFHDASWFTKEQIDSISNSGAIYYGDKTTTHGIDFSILAKAGYTSTLKKTFKKLNLPDDFAQHICDTVLAYNDYYTLNQKMVFSFTSENGNTYKYVLGRIDRITSGSYNEIISILVPGHPALPGEHFYGSFYPCASSSFTSTLTYDVTAYREDFNLGYELPNDVRERFGLSRLDGNVNTWKQWRAAYKNDRSKLIKTMCNYK